MDKIVLSKDVYQKTEIGKIPRDWEVKKINEIAEVNKENLSGNTPAGYEFYYYDLSSVDKGKVLHPTEKLKFADAPSRAKRLFKRNDVLMSTVRPNLQGFTYVDFDSTNSVCSTGFAVIAGKYESDSMYIYQNLFSYGITRQIQKLLVGSNYPAINSKDVENLKVPFPNDKKEREKIASILSTWDKAIELKEKLIEQKKEQKKGLMQKLLTGEVRLPGYEGEWKSVELKHVVEKVIDNRGKTPPLSTEGFELIEVNALEGNKFPDYLKVKKYVDDTTYWTWFRNGHPQKDDILVATVGSVGSTVIMNENRGCIAQNLIALRIKEEYNAEFIYYWMNSNQYFSLINKVLMGAVQPSLKVPHLLQFKIQLPIQREQEKIAEILSNHDETIRLLEREIIYLKHQKQGLMQQLLSGKVRVKV